MFFFFAVEVFDHLSELRELGQNEEGLQDLNVHYKLTSLKSTTELQLTDDLASVLFLCPNLQRLFSKEIIYVAHISETNIKTIWEY